LISEAAEEKKSPLHQQNPGSVPLHRWANPRIANLSAISYLKVKMHQNLSVGSSSELRASIGCKAMWDGSGISKTISIGESRLSSHYQLLQSIP
jgi:hypothetical protein